MIPVWFRRWQIHVELPEPGDPPDLPGIAARRGAEPLDRALGEVLARHGLPRSALVIVRHLSNRLILDGDPDDDAVALGLARGVAGALDRALRERSTPDEVRVYVSRTAAERAWLWDRAASGARSWWSALVFEGGVEPAPVELIGDHLERAPRETLRLLVQVGPGLPRLLTLSDADEIARRVDALVRDRRSDLLAARESRGAARPPVPTPLADEPAGTALLPRAHRVLLRAAVLATRANTPHWPDAAARRLLAHGAASADAAGVPREFAATERAAAVHAAASEPQESTFEGNYGAASLPSEGGVDAAVTPRAEPAPADGVQPSAAVAASEENPDRAKTTKGAPSSPTELVAPVLVPRPDEPESGFDPFLLALGRRPAAHVAHWHRVCCGGLLFLLRPALRGPWGDEPALLPERLWALGRLTLDRLLQPLPPAERRSCLEREAVLLEALSGRHVEDPALAQADRQRAREALVELDRIVSLLPDGMEAPLQDQRSLYGGRTALLAEHLDASLAWLVLRPGELRLRDDDVLLRLPLRTVDVALRRAGLDLDPGWVPWIGRVIRYEYVS